MSFKVVAFYTVDTPYEQESQELKTSLERFKIPHIIKGFPSRNSWVENCAIKPEFILEMLEDNREDILYLDADARVFSDLQYFHTVTADIGVHYRQGVELLSGTLFFKNNHKTKHLVHTWVREQKQHKNKWDQKVLASCIAMQDVMDWKLQIHKLPVDYCQIFDNKPQAAFPQIVHYQASRKYKHKINIKDAKVIEDKPTVKAIEMPTQIYGMRIRMLADGTFAIPRKNKEVEKYLDNQYHRIPRSLKWAPKAVPSKDWKELVPVFKNKVCYIIGKGPSLDNLKAETFKDPEDPIFCINETIHIIEKLKLPNPVFAIQQDTNLKTKCKPKQAYIFISQSCKNWYADFDRKYIYSSLSLGITHHRLTAVSATTIAKELGCINFKFCCFDACVNKKTDYAKVIGYSPAEVGDPKRFLQHRNLILSVCRGCNVDWVTP